MLSVLVANRGEIAVRIIRAVHEAGGRAIAVHPADDATSRHVLLADDVVQLPGAGTAAYLDIEAVTGAAVDRNCAMVHPGYGFLSENPEFARRCAELGLTFIGPDAETLDLFGDKARARHYATARGVPVVPGTEQATSLAQARDFAAQHGAVMIKALAGGGGRGMRAVTDPSTLAEAYAQASGEAQKAFGRGDVYVEKLVTEPRHLEVQIVGDGTGAVAALGERDCSIQRRHQKLVEVAPSPWLYDEQRAEIIGAATTLAAGVNYRGLGTFEFLVQGDEFWFMEANPRLQVEHTVTEEVTGVDLVGTQLAIADGRSLADLGLTEPPAVRGVAIQVRVNTETLADDGSVVPAAGTLQRLELPSAPGVRVDSYGYSGYEINPRYDSLLAKVIAHGADLRQATARVRQALEELEIAGVDTNADLLHGVVTADDFTERPWTTAFIPDHLGELVAHRRPRSVVPDGAAESASVAVEPDLAESAVAVRAPNPGVVVQLAVEPGQVVATNQPVALVEAMKMEHVVRAPQAMTVSAVVAPVGSVVAGGDLLLHGVPGEHDDVHADINTAIDDDPDWAPEVAEIERRRDAAHRMGGEQKLARQHGEGKLDARQRICALADEGSFREIGVLAGFVDGALRDEDQEFTPSNFVAGTARLGGRKVLLGVDDFTLRGGSGDAAIHDKQIFAERYAREMRLPVVRLLDGASGGGSVKMAIDAGYTYIPINPGWDAVVDNLSIAPVVSAALGPTVGLGAARMVMSHLAVMVDGVGQLFTAGPPVVEGGTGEKLTKEQLGGADVHRDNGAIERIVATEQDAFDVIRDFLSYLPSSVFELPPVREGHDPVDRRDEALLGAVPRNPRRLYELRTLLDAIFDEGSVFPYAEYGRGVFTGLARLDGHPVGVLATDPHAGATMGVEGALAATRLVDLCETFHLPLISLTDQAGMTIGSAAEKAAVIRHGARAITAVYQARIPQAEIIVRRIYGVGGAGIVNRHRSVRSWAWPSSDWGSLPSRGGAEAAFRAQIAAAPDPTAELDRLAGLVEAVGSPFRTAAHFGVQDIIDPRETRPLLCDWVHDAYRLLPELLGRPSFGTRP